MFGEFESMGKNLITLGIILVIVGAVIHFGGKLTGLGKLPGDIHIQRDNFSFHFPIVTSIVVSIILTVVVNLLFRR